VSCHVLHHRESSASVSSGVSSAGATVGGAVSTITTAAFFSFSAVLLVSDQPVWGLILIVAAYGSPW
jgi:hypothetical protein